MKKVIILGGRGGILTVLFLLLMIRPGRAADLGLKLPSAPLPAPARDCLTPVSGLQITQDTVFCSGTHQVENIKIDVDGTPEDPLEVSCEPGTVFDGFLGTDPDSSASYADAAISLRGSSIGSEQGEWADYIKISGCTFKNYHKGIQGGRYVTYENNEFDGLIRHAITVFDYGVVKNNYFHGFLKPADFHEPYSLVSFFGSHASLEDNLITNTNGRMVLETFFEPSGECQPRISDLEVKNNVFNSQEGGLYFQCAENLLIENNLFYGDINRDSFTVFDFRSSKNALVRNNTVADNSGPHFLVSNIGSEDLTFKNNITAFNRAGIRSDLAIDYGYNNSFGNEEYDYWDLDPALGNNISEDPSFLDKANPAGPDSLFWTQDDGLRLNETSPSVDAGDPGMTDPDGSRIDMGAYGGTALATASPLCFKPIKGLKLTKTRTSAQANTALTCGRWKPPLK